MVGVTSEDINFAENNGFCKVIDPPSSKRKKGKVFYDITFEIKGIVGCCNKRIITYRCYCDLRNFPVEAPDVFILDPPDSDIKHVNVFRPMYCDRKKKRLPYVCLGKYFDKWMSLDYKYRTFALIVQSLNTILHTENFNDRAEIFNPRCYKQGCE
ncbi:MAG: hypothetical protein ACTSYD_13935 [Candidatus Heimdallarchaeaceae archaeon]